MASGTIIDIRNIRARGTAFDTPDINQFSMLTHLFFVYQRCNLGPLCVHDGLFPSFKRGLAEQSEHDHTGDDQAHADQRRSIQLLVVHHHRYHRQGGNPHA